MVQSFNAEISLNIWKEKKTMEKLEGIRLASGKIAYSWQRNEKPCVNHWYQIRLGMDLWKIVKDFYSPETKETYYKIVAYYNCDIIYSGRTLMQARQIIRNNTYRMVI